MDRKNHLGKKINDNNEKTFILKENQYRPNHNNPKKSLYFWEKLASKPADENQDKCDFYEIEDDPDIREVIRYFESKKMGERLLFSDINPRNPSVKKWLNKIRLDYPNKNDDTVEDLLNTFRESLYPRSREKHRLIVALIVLNNVILLVHCKKDPSLAELNNKIYPVNLILHPKNVLRTAIIRNENGKTTFSAFEYSRKWSKGHAEFWGINVEEISWESLGNVTLKIELTRFEHTILLPIEFEELDDMINRKGISPSGKIDLGREQGTINKVDVYRTTISFEEFYDFYIINKEELEKHKKEFNKLMGAQINLDKLPENGQFRYEEDINSIFELTSEGRKKIYDKSHPRFIICFFSPKSPGIKPIPSFINKMHKSIFNNIKKEIWHAGKESTTEPLVIGTLNIFNKIEIPEELPEFSNNLLNIIQDIDSKKSKLLLQILLCYLWKDNVNSEYFKFLFESIIHSIIVPELDFEFKREGIVSDEEYVEYKSATKVDPKPIKFVNELVETARKYLVNGELHRYCILYGIEDNKKFRPIYNLPSDKIPEIEKKVNEILSTDGITVKIQSIPFKSEKILAIILLPSF